MQDGQLWHNYRQKEELIMKYTEYGLCITLEELRNLLECAQAEAKHGNMESCIYIKGGQHPKITQYCCYQECNPINHTYNVH